MRGLKVAYFWSSLNKIQVLEVPQCFHNFNCTFSALKLVQRTW